MAPLFSPSVHSQRHQYVLDYVTRNKPKKVADLGCCDCSLLRKLKFHREIEFLCGVDLNGATMRKKIRPRPPLAVELYVGSVLWRDARLRGFDLMTSLELIEHLRLEDVAPFTRVLFGFMAPAAVIVSTPNADFNPLFPRMPGFRDPDHKFEWTRAEFQSWALAAAAQYGYEAEFTGVGQAEPHLHLQVGFCTQIAVFQRRPAGGGGRRSGGRRGGAALRRPAGGGGAPAAGGGEETFSYTLLYSVSYPSLRDHNVLRGCLVSEVLYWAHKLCGRRRLEDRDRDRDRGRGSPAGRTEREMWPTEEYGEGEEEEEEEEGLQVGEDVKRTNGGQLESYRQGRCVCVPLDRVWSCCRRLRELSGSLDRLRLFIADDPLVTLSPDGFAVVLDEEEEEEEAEEEEEDEEEEEEDARSVEASCLHVKNEEEEENWEDQY
ncbi:Small RNA 2'-O-methyltransferase [Merluccius polli]|uniref:Small RNA 2'-O-methyltransferase n=1 Tax=Merluccius polli TaxID=89951 RepID=A0AA47NRK0_MERPO|nr:Small RNA 2'-O-methyltransferase [Merluccius polli]